MPTYNLSEDEIEGTSAISGVMFGTNFVTNFDFEFLTDSGAIDVLKDLDVTTLRFPGGTITETEFADEVFMKSQWDRDFYHDVNGNEVNLTGIDEFMQSASAVGADVILVLPTRVAFEKSAGQSLFDQTYGHRTAIAPDYFDQLDAYIEYATYQAELYGVEIVQFEIGNEFWLGGQMTAAEYGYLAAEITTHLNDRHPDVEIVVQVVSAANKYSPLSSKTVYLEPDGQGDFIVHHDPSNTMEGSEDWLPAVLPGQGNVTAQIDDIAEQFNLNPDAIIGLDGVVDHVYFDAGISDIDNQRDFSLNYPFARFSDMIGRNDLNYYISEWSPRNIESSSIEAKFANDENLGNANGLQLSHTTIEAFYELASNGVDGANFWPLTFGNPNIDNRVLIDTSELDLTFSGVALQLMAESLVGLNPVLDMELTNVIDIHGFRDQTSSVLFVGERSGEFQEINLSLGELTPSPAYFVTATILSSDDGSFDQVDADPALTYLDGYVHDSDVVSFELEAWEILRVELQSVTNHGDTIWGRDGDDRIEGFGGNDVIGGGGGTNYLDGGAGFDTALFSGSSFQYDITQSESDPSTWYVLRDGNIDTLRNFEAIQFSDQTLYLSQVNLTGLQIYGTSNDDSLFGNIGNDIVNGGQGNDHLSGGSGNDQLIGISGTNNLYGDDGDDFIIGGSNFDEIYGGNGNDFIKGDASAIFGGSDEIIGGQGDDILMGGIGSDTFIFGTNDGNNIIANFENEEVDYLNDQIDNQALSGPDFQSGVDSIQLVGFENVNTNNVESFLYEGSSGVIFEAENTVINFYGLEINDLNPTDFDFL